MNTLIMPMIRVIGPGNVETRLTLPGVLAGLVRDEVVAFPALRPHQRHAWHSFLVLLAANALRRAELAEPPDTEAAWCDLLRNLTPNHPDDAPWCLVAPIDRPALLQPPIPSGVLAELKNRIATPDGLDMLVTAKNHDLKQAVMTAAAPEDWLFALLTLQTMEGFLGAGNYGISRMNGGFANRAAVSIAPPGGPGAHLRRDLRRLQALRGRDGTEGFAPSGGLALVWLAPWDGTTSLRHDALDENYIEICRRVRLTEEGGRLVAHAGSSKAARILPVKGGVTGDPWSPVAVDKDGALKSLTVDGRGLGYRRMVEFMFGGVRPAPLQADAEDDATTGLHVLARALVRGQGKTEGYHERRVPLSRTIRRGLRQSSSDPVAQAAKDRVELAGIMQDQVLKAGLLALFQNGPAKVDFRDKDSLRKAETFLKRFDAAVDLDFFEALWAEMEAEDPPAQRQQRCQWVEKLLTTAELLLNTAESAAARSSHRRYRAVVRARDRLRQAARSNQMIQPYLSQGQAQ
jgi:CRISPR system Cascade subunit CasA